MSLPSPISISGCGALSVLGHDLAAHHAAIAREPARFRPLSEMPGTPPGFENQHAGWIESRSLLTHRKWSPPSVAAIHVAREALDAAGWSAAERRNAAVFAGTSRGALAGWIEPWPGRRPFGLMAASNSLPSEPASAVSSEFGIEGPWQLLSSGCCAGLDALGMAFLWLNAGLAERALVISVDLPLVTPILKAYADTGILSSRDHCAPLSPESDGMIPAEGAAAICLERGHSTKHAQLLSYLTVGDCADPLGGASEHPSLTRMIRQAMDSWGRPALVVPHASGTHAQAISEPAALVETIGPDCSTLPLKAWTGHTIGASGLLEASIIASSMTHDASPSSPELNLPPSSRVFKIASAMGGKHSLIALQSPS
ncbi:beta-ketoacyl synthase N-terminal-like domain-containing protein [Haloferula chungangensis]|uniref:Beta-ketoacyl synthase N-terminal-like domain-containing protein n=1 Tax=Haloferula chungangensis TaxID=1048331 RepID=A0ABW2L428_9BACT